LKTIHNPNPIAARNYSIHSTEAKNEIKSLPVVVKLPESKPVVGAVLPKIIENNKR
jgi:hypothetical protein